MILLFFLGLFLLIFFLILGPEWKWNKEVPVGYSKFISLKAYYYKHHKKINIENCKKMLKEFKYFMDKHNINDWWLSEGTALGIHRDGNLIPWDDDVDVYIWEKDKHFMYKTILPEILKSKKFDLIKGNNHIICLFHRQYNERLDIAVFQENGYCDAGETDCLKSKEFLKEFYEKEIDGEIYRLPKQDEYYSFLYGPNWKLPDKNRKSKA